MERPDTFLLLEARNIEKEYEGYTIFNALSLRLFSRQSLSIRGRSGEGKSTLLHILSGIEPPSQGELYFRNANFRDLDLDQLRSRSFGFVFQSFHLMEERDVLANVLLPVEVARWPGTLSKQQWQQRAETLLDRVGLQNKRYQKAATLSGGEKQRVCIARALMLQPDILFLDEPTGNLDLDTARETTSLLFSLFQEGTVSSLVIVTHDPLLAEKADRQFVLSQGKIKEVGGE